MRNDVADFISLADAAGARYIPSRGDCSVDATGGGGTRGGAAARTAGLVATAGDAPPASDMPGSAARGGEAMAPGSRGLAGRFRLLDRNTGFLSEATPPAARAGVLTGKAVT